MIERIKKRREELGLTQEGLAQKLGLNGKTIWRIENEKREVKLKTLNRIADALNTSAAFLMGETDNPQPRKIVTIQPDPGNKLSKGNRNIVNFDQNTGPIVPHMWLPLLNHEVCAGRGFDYDDLVPDAKEWIPWPVDKMGGPSKPKLPFFIPVNGDSMLSAGIKDGDMVLVNPNIDVRNGNVVYVEWCGMRSIKAFVQYPSGEIELQSGKPTIYLTSEQALSSDFRVIGKVIKSLRENNIPENVI